MTGVIAWAIRTPQRLIAVLAVPLLVTLLVASLWSVHSHGSGGNDNAGVAAAAANAQIPDATPFVTTAIKFVNVWGRLAPGQSPDQWHEAVNALATPELATALAKTDTSSLPGSSIAGKPSVRYMTASDAIIAVPLSDGTSVVVSVITKNGNTWLVRDIQPDVGN